MRFLHISDLHLGKSMSDIRLAEEDQPFWIDKFIETVKEAKPDAVVIAGDIYDRSSPSAEAVKLFDRLVCSLAEMNVAVLAAAGNHDSGERLSFASKVLAKEGVFIAGVPEKEIMKITLSDSFGPVNFWLLPYIYPQAVNFLLGCEDIKDYDTAFRRLLAAQDIDLSQRNVIVAHQNVTRNGKEADRGGSESMIAGIGGIEYTAFDGFEYAALGHIHAAQYVGREGVRYAGSPLCYHFDELRFPKKGPVLVELKAKNEAPEISVIGIPPLHRLRILRGSIDEIISAEQKTEARNEYLKAEITGSFNEYNIRELRSIVQMHGSILQEAVSVRPEGNTSAYDPCGAPSDDRSVTELFTEFYSYIYKKNGEERSVDSKEAELISVAAEELERTDISVKNAAAAIAEKIVSAARAQES